MEYEEFKDLIGQGKTIIVLDTNVILDLCRYCLYTSKNILQIFNECSDLIWIPNQVHKEYNKNKYSVFGNLKKRYSDFEKKLLNIIDESETKIANELKYLIRYKYFRNKEFKDNIRKKTEEIRNIIKKYKDEVGTEYDEIRSASPKIVKEIEEFVSSLETNKQIGEEIGFKELLKIIEEGELRYKYKLPPGFKDDGKVGIDKFGDLFIWKEIIKLPSYRNIDNIIFITNDGKCDWWSNKECLEARPELLSEFNDTNPGKNIRFMKMSEFQKLASELYNLYEFGVYVDLNRNDDSYIERVDSKIVEYISDVICNNGDYYLNSDDVGSEGISDIEFEECAFCGVHDVYYDSIDDEVHIFYELEYEVTVSCNSHEYWGRDDDTKELITSLIGHTFSGSVIVSLERIITKTNIESDKDYLNEDKSSENLEIIDYYFEQTQVERYEDGCYDEEFALEKESFTCPKCGIVLSNRSEDMGGVCSKCSFED